MTGDELVRMDHETWVETIAFSPDGQWVATASSSTARIWNAVTGKELTRMNHEYSIGTVVFSPDSGWVATAGKDGTARVWETISGREVSRMTLGGEAVIVGFSPDGRRLAGYSGNEALVWYWRSEDLIAEACARVTRNLNRAEWEHYLPGEPYRLTCPNLPEPAD